METASLARCANATDGIPNAGICVLRLCVHAVGKHKHTRRVRRRPQAKHTENVSCLLACRSDGVPDGGTAVGGLKDGIHGIPN